MVFCVYVGSLSLVLIKILQKIYNSALWLSYAVHLGYNYKSHGLQEESYFIGLRHFCLHIFVYCGWNYLEMAEVANMIYSKIGDEGDCPFHSCLFISFSVMPFFFFSKWTNTLCCFPTGVHFRTDWIFWPSHLLCDRVYERNLYSDLCRLCLLLLNSAKFIKNIYNIELFLYMYKGQGGFSMSVKIKKKKNVVLSK